MKNNRVTDNFECSVLNSRLKRFNVLTLQLSNTQNSSLKTSIAYSLIPNVSIPGILPFLFALLFISATGFSQQNKNCLENIKAVYQALEKQAAEKEGNVHFSYVSTVTLSKEYGGEKISDTTYVYSDGTKSYLESGRINVYEDHKTRVTILNDKKRISIFNYSPGIKKARLPFYTAQQDTLLQLAKVKSCKMLNNGDQEIVLEFGAFVERYYKINSITYWINPTKKALRKVRMNYVENPKIKTVEMVFLTTDFNYKGNKLNKSPEAMVKKGKKLLPKYKSFELTDNRKRS